ncbi:hypothetical protein CKJ54_24710 (plasmid) [Mycobacterium marseillense]|uniref:Uncharacterized protein n=1 Tax=Mycobacterium marseillense TaxID=701042 RepID=A0AAC9YPG5_9MYCO|nr:hypothetical protein CKJ54_24710 [Mycobacterium marseillense]
MNVAAYLEKLDRLLTRAHELFAAGDIALPQAHPEAAGVATQDYPQSADIRDSARLHIAALAPIVHHPTGMKLLMAVMDDHLAAMQLQLAATRTGS